MKPTMIVILVIFVWVGTSSGAVVPNSVTVTEVSYATTQDEAEVAYSHVVVAVPELPNDGVLDDAFLEFIMDVESALADSLSDGMATIEVSTVPTLVEGRLPVGEMTILSTRMVRIGNNQVVRVYITDALREAMSTHASELNLLVGPISGSRRGRFEAKAIPGHAGNVKATLTVRARREFNLEQFGIE